MAQENETNAAETGTNSTANIAVENELSNTCPNWDKLGSREDMPEFFNPGEELKRAGFKVMFLRNGPRKESLNRFKEGAIDYWFDVMHAGKAYTWTISQISLLIALKSYGPLAGQEFLIRLVPVDEAFLRERPKYKGKDRYQVTPLASDGSPVVVRGGSQEVAGQPEGVAQASA